jgi:hypothetical protein
VEKVPLNKKLAHAKLAAEWRACACDFCDVTFPALSHLYHHISQGHQVAIFPCWLCHRRFRGIHLLSAHLLAQHLTRFDCPFCCKVFDGWPALKGHTCRPEQRPSAAAVHEGDAERLADREGAGPKAAVSKTTTLKGLKRLDGAFVCPHAGCCHTYKDFAKLREHLGHVHQQQNVLNAELRKCFTSKFECSTCQEKIDGWAAFRRHHQGHNEINRKVASNERTLLGQSRMPETSAGSVPGVPEGEDDELEVLCVSSSSEGTRPAGVICCTQCSQTFASYGQMLRHRFSNH